MDQAEVDEAEVSDEEGTQPTPSQRKRLYKLDNGVTMRVGS
jgi:hypothetical protein